MTDEETIKNFAEVVYPMTANAGDPDGYAALYAEDALWSPPDAPDRRGPANIRFGYIAKNADIDATMKVDDHAVVDDLGYVTALARVVVTPRDGTPPTTYFYRHQWVFRKIQGIWKIAHQIWTPKPTRLMAPLFADAP